MQNHLISLRAVEPEDVELMYKADNDPNSIQYTSYIAPLSRQLLLEYALTYDADPYKTGQLRLIIENLEGVAVGIADLYEISAIDSRACVGIYILPGFRKKGFGTEALRVLRNYACKTLGIGKLVAKIPRDNVSSLSLFTKSGFSQIALLPAWHRVAGKLADIILLSVPTE